MQTMLTVGDLSTIDENARFRTDVQISAFEDAEENLSLVRSYIFTNHAPPNKLSSVKLVNHLEERFNGYGDNRMVAIAGFGHGKTHLGLTILNLFSKPFESDEFQELLAKFRSAGGEVAAGKLRQFREERGEFLVIRLRGDKPSSLREQFLSGLRTALDEHDATRGLIPPLWFGKAAAWLETLAGDQISKASDFLRPQRMDLSGLKAALRSGQDGMYDICITLHRHLFTTTPNFGGEVELDKVMVWLTEYCGPGKPLGGVLVLFDEFSLYIQKFATKSAAGELMELLNGVQPDSMRRKVVFLALAQQDPETTANNAYQSAHISKTTQESLNKELTRLPSKERHSLYSLLESVIDSYLGQPEALWQQFIDDDHRARRIAEATNIAFELFRNHYVNTLGWDIGTFRDRVTKGCFPLHPLTTALLCHADFQGGGQGDGAARTVLGFVEEARTRRADRPAADASGRINWALAVELVDYFEQRLPADLRTSLRNAVPLLDEEDKQTQHRILQALLLQTLTGLSVRDSRQVEMVAAMVGLDDATTRFQLGRLMQLNAVRYDSNTKSYSLWPAGNNWGPLQAMLAQKLQNVVWDSISLAWLNEYDLVKEMFPDIPIEMGWGHAQDWSAPNRLVTLREFSDAYLAQEVGRYQVQGAGTWQEGKRGAVFWLLAGTAEELNQARVTVIQRLDAFQSLSGAPIIGVLPLDVTPSLFGISLRLRTLDRLTTQERTTAGIAVYNHEVARQRDLLKEVLTQIAGAKDPHTVVRPAARYAVATSSRGHAEALGATSVKPLLKRLYTLTYASAPPKFFDDYRVASQGPNKLGDAVKQVANTLLLNTIGTAKSGFAGVPVANRLYELLRDDWKLVAHSGQIQVPEDPRIRSAWNLLDEKFVAGAGQVRVLVALQPLMNAPFGYDYNTATLLFCAWVGYHRQEAEISVHGVLRSVEYLAARISSVRPGAFVQELCVSDHVTLKRRKREEIEEQVVQLIKQIEAKDHTQPEAISLLAELAAVRGNSLVSQATSTQAHQVYDRLAASLETAHAYDDEAALILSALNVPSVKIREVLELRDRIQKLPNADRVTPTTPRIEAIGSRWQQYVTQTVETLCATYERLEHMTNLGRNQQALATLKRQLSSGDLNEYLHRVTKAEQRLEENAGKLTLSEDEERIRIEIRMMQISADLGTLYKYKKRLVELADVKAIDTVNLRSSTLDKVTAEIERLEELAADLLSRLESVTTHTDVAALQMELARNEQRFQGSAKRSMIQQAAQRAVQLLAFFERLSRQRNTPIQTPADSEEVEKRLDKLRSDYSQILLPAQVQCIADVRSDVEQKVAQRQSEAHAWYQQCEAEFAANRGLHQLRASLGVPPAFLSPADWDRVGILRDQVQKRLNEDVVGQIVSLFRSISDFAMRKDCLEQLRGLAISEKVKE